MHLSFVKHESDRFHVETLTTVLSKRLLNLFSESLEPVVVDASKVELENSRIAINDVESQI
jgi:hypothetical protein